MRYPAYSGPLKEVVWLGRSKSDLKSFPSDVIDDMGHQLFLVQMGREPDDWKPMPAIGMGVKEIRVRDVAGAFRTLYLATRPEAIYVLHCFQKKTERTAPVDIDRAHERLKEIRTS